MEKYFLHIAGIGALDKSAALGQNTVKGFVAHKIAGLGFFLLIFQDTLKIRFDADQKVHIICNILIFIKGIFRKKDRQLGLNPKTWPQRLFQKVAVTKRDFGVEV